MKNSMHMHMRNLFAGFIGLMALATPSLAADGGWREQVSRQQQMLVKMTSCPPAINAKADALVENQNTLPEHLRFANSLSLKFDPRDLVKSLPPDVVKQMSAEMLKSLQADMPDRDEIYKKDPPGFMSKTHATLAIQNRATQYCQRDCEQTIALSTTAALALWKSACLLCTADHLAFIQTPTGMAIDSRIAEWLTTSAAPTIKAFPLNNKKVSYFQRMEGHIAKGGALSAPQSDTERAKSLLAYVDLSSELKARLCSISYFKPDAARALRALGATACGTPAAETDEDRVSMRIALLTDRTSCGSVSQFYACGLPDNSIELTFAKVQYVFPSQVGGPELQYGQEGGDRFSGFNTLIHELGHWFGLPHIQDDQHPDPRISAKELPDVMQSSLGKVACISPLSMMLINNMSDQDYQNRFRSGGGLRRR